jgi:Skp family chaperone for outer membrane proteins
MKRTLLVVTLTVLTLALAAAAQTSSSNAPAPTKIGVINIQQAIARTNEGQRDLQAMEKRLTPKRNELQSAQTEIENLQEQLKTQGDKLNETAHAELERNIATKTKRFEADYEDYETDTQSQENEVARQIMPTMMKIIKKYTTDNGYAVILDISSIVSANANTPDITQAIIDAYNAQSSVAPPSAESAPKTTSPAKPGAASPTKK